MVGFSANLKADRLWSSKFGKIRVMIGFGSGSEYLPLVGSHVVAQVCAVASARLHCVSKKDTTQPPSIISTIVVRFQ